MKVPRDVIFVRRGLGGSCERRETVRVSEGRRRNGMTQVLIEEEK
jgi:hypothetical protein